MRQIIRQNPPPELPFGKFSDSFGRPAFWLTDFFTIFAVGAGHLTPRHFLDNKKRYAYPEHDGIVGPRILWLSTAYGPMAYNSPPYEEQGKAQHLVQNHDSDSVCRCIGSILLCRNSIRKISGGRRIYSPLSDSFALYAIIHFCWKRHIKHQQTS